MGKKTAPNIVGEKKHPNQHVVYNICSCVAI